jgi:cell division protein ZapA (FtsZ GTPase activity inhibitor)
MVEIAGQRYPIRSTLKPAYVAQLAAYVDEKIRAASDAAPASDLLGLTVLAALNIADELHRSVERQSSSSGDLNARALRLERLVDEALAIC